MGLPDRPLARRVYYEAENHDRKSKWRKLKPWVETVGVGIAPVLAFLSLLTWLQIRRQADIYQEQALMPALAVSTV